MKCECCGKVVAKITTFHLRRGCGPNGDGPKSVAEYRERYPGKPIQDNSMMKKPGPKARADMDPMAVIRTIDLRAVKDRLKEIDLRVEELDAERLTLERVLALIGPVTGVSGSLLPPEVADRVYRRGEVVRG